MPKSPKTCRSLRICGVDRLAYASYGAGVSFFYPVRDCVSIESLTHSALVSIAFGYDHEERTAF